jgi:hypothetical protein
MVLSKVVWKVSHSSVKKRDVPFKKASPLFKKAFSLQKIMWNIEKLIQQVIKCNFMTHYFVKRTTNCCHALTYNNRKNCSYRQRACFVWFFANNWLKWAWTSRFRMTEAMKSCCLMLKYIYMGNRCFLRNHP